MTNKKTYFDMHWLQQDQFKPWLSQVAGNPSSARCQTCLKSFSLSNMGEQALLSHARGKKHMRAVESLKSVPLSAFFSSGKSQPVPSEMKISESSGTSQPIPSEITISERPSHSATSNLKGIQGMLQRDSVTKAEILWCLKLVHSHDSQNSGGDAVHLFSLMFPDSDIASKMKLQRTKIAYTINFGLAPHFFQALQDICADCDHLVVGFDESLNKVAEKGQMDLFVRFWDTKQNKVCTRYYKSSFLGHATAVDLLSSFREGTAGLNIRKLMQVSMDGPNVNKKFFSDLMKELSEEDVNRPELINIGSCGLHQVHNAYKKSMRTNNWGIIEFLRALYYLFHLSPARREDYFNFSGSSVYPLKFCAVRWVENFRVAGRALQILDNVQKYVEGVKRDKKKPSCKSFGIVSSALEDKLIRAKLAFFRTVASDVEPFLIRFQANDPLSPLLYGALLKMMRTVMSRFVKETILKSATNIARIDLKNSDNLKALKDIDLGFETRKALNLSGIRIKCINDTQFRNECRNSLIQFCEALMKNSPLLYPLTKYISCLDPLMVMQPTKRTSRLTYALEHFVEKNWLSGQKADCIARQFNEVSQTPLFEDKMKNFSDQRLDDFWLGVIPSRTEFDDSRYFLKMVLILSHGNAFAERGFSINKEILMDNLSNDSLIAQRQVYDALVYYGGIEKIDINKKMIQAARNANGFYQEALKKKRETADAEMKRKAEKRKAADKLKALEKKKKDVIDSARNEIENLDIEMKKLI